MPNCFASDSTWKGLLLTSKRIQPLEDSVRRAILSGIASGCSGNHTPGWQLPESMALAKAAVQTLQQMVPWFLF